MASEAGFFAFILCSALAAMIHLTTCCGDPSIGQYFGYGSNASFCAWADDLRSTSISRHSQSPSACLKGANRRHAKEATEPYVVDTPLFRHRDGGDNLW